MSPSFRGQGRPSGRGNCAPEFTAVAGYFADSALASPRPPGEDDPNRPSYLT